MGYFSLNGNAEQVEPNLTIIKDLIAMLRGKDFRL